MKNIEILWKIILIVIQKIIYPKLNDEHRRFILKWLDQGIHNSTNQISIHLNGIKTLTKIGYDSVNAYIHQLGRWVKPSVISERNLTKRREYCLSQRDFIVDEDFFLLMSELNRNVFKFARDAMPEIEKLSTWVRQISLSEKRLLTCFLGSGISCKIVHDLTCTSTQSGTFRDGFLRTPRSILHNHQI